MLDYAPMMAVTALFVVAWYYRRSRAAAGLVPIVEVTVRVPATAYRLARSRPLVFVISTLTGVSITFCPAVLVGTGPETQR